MQGSRLTEKEVRERLDICADKPDVINELYDYGKVLNDEVLDRIRAIESKAVSFAAYGAAIVTLLVSSASLWSKAGNHWSSWISICAGLCGLICTCFALRALWLREYQWISEDEWMKKEGLAKIETMKRYRILTMWGTIHDHSEVHREKGKELQCAQTWLIASLVYLVYLLLHVAFVVDLANKFWIPFWQRMIEGHLRIPSWQRCGGWACSLILISTLAWFIWRTRHVRLL